MSLIPLFLWLPLSVAACVLPVLAAMGWLWRTALRVPADSRDGRPVRHMAAIGNAGLLLWLVYGLFKAYGALWQADALLIMAQGPGLRPCCWAASWACTRERTRTEDASLSARAVRAQGGLPTTCAAAAARYRSAG